MKKMLIIAIAASTLLNIKVDADAAKALQNIGTLQLYFNGYTDKDGVVHAPVIQELKNNLNEGTQKNADVRVRAKAVAKVFIAGSAPLYELAMFADNVLDSVKGQAGEAQVAAYEAMLKKGPTQAAIEAYLKDKSTALKAYAKLKDPVAKFKGMTGQMYTFAKTIDSFIAPPPLPSEPKITADEATSDELFN